MQQQTEKAIYVQWTHAGDSWIHHDYFEDNGQADEQIKSYFAERNLSVVTIERKKTAAETTAAEKRE